MAWSGAAGGSFNFVLYYDAPPPTPRCHACSGPAQRQTAPDRKLWCARCLAADQAATIFEILFQAATTEQRARLYRSLSAVYHPDVGGDVRIMQALNAVKDRFP